MSTRVAVLTLLALVLAWGPAACAVQSGDCQASDRVTISVVRHRWHTGIVLPAEEVTPSLGFLRERFSGARYLEIGWGDGEFYRKPDSTWLIMRALFWPTDTVLHVVGLERPPEEYPHGGLLRLSLARNDLRRLQESLAADFSRDNGGVVVVEPGLYGDSTFFEARGTFWFAYTCNTWTAERLADAGVPLRAFMTLTADSVMDQLREAKRKSPCLDPDSGRINR
jgi:uncharacterized protein (TIGR02117 family)